MNLKYITCSDPRNHNSIEEMFGLWRIDPRVEIAVQMHPKKVSPETERYKWICEMLHQLTIRKGDYNFAVHINQDWCIDLVKGHMPEELGVILHAKKPLGGDIPLVKRIQLNMPQTAVNEFNPRVVKSVVDYFRDQGQEVIFQYNNLTKDAVEQLHQTRAEFSLLFDASGGRGELPKSWESPIYPGQHMQGYAGGLRPENVSANLDKIAEVAGIFPTWIDAEGGLQSETGELKPDSKPVKLFNSARAAEYIQSALAWEQKAR